MSRILVTGSSGFIGARIVEALLAKGETVLAASRQAQPARERVIPVRLELSAPDAAAQVSVLKADTLIHAAWVTAHGQFWTSPENEAWVAASSKLVTAFLAGGGKRVIGIGTCAEYDLSGEGLLDELVSPIAPSTPYGMAKDRARCEMAALCQEAGASFAWGRLFHLFGRAEPSQRLVPSVILSLLAGEEARTTIGSQQRDFLHAHDAGRAIAHVARSNLEGAVNIGSGERVTIAGLVRRIADMLEAAHLLRCGAVPLSPSEPLSILPRLERLTSTGFRADFDLGAGLEDVIAYWKATHAP